jgi:8-oxo-dGTP pyrophosphatase MutT (NUDIX family)
MVKTWLEKALSINNPAARGARSDFDLNREADQEELMQLNLRAAAVLIPIVQHEHGETVLLTKRTEQLSKHAGQVSFPGGSIDPEDADAVAAALRETHEEIGLGHQHIEVLGELDQYRTGTGFEITPIVGLVQPGFVLDLAPDEVADAFEVPLSFFLDRDNHQQQSAVWKGRRRHYYAMPYDEYFIWGATAAMLVNLVDVLEAVREEA